MSSIRRTTSRTLSILLHTEIFKMQAKALDWLSLYSKEQLLNIILVHSKIPSTKLTRGFLSLFDVTTKANLTKLHACVGYVFKQFMLVVKTVNLKFNFFKISSTLNLILWVQDPLLGIYVLINSRLSIGGLSNPF